MRFLCGVKKFRAYPSEIVNILHVGKSINDSASVTHEVTFDTLHWLFEAQDNDVIAELLGSSDI